MKNKILIGIVIILAAIFIFENAYLLGKYSKGNANKIIVMKYQPLPVARLPENNPYSFNQMRVWDPFAEMNRMQERMNRVFENNFSAVARNMPKANMSVESSVSFNDTENAYIVKVALAGLDKNSIKIKTMGRELIISSENKNAKTQEGKNYYSQESSYGNFLSSFMLPEDAKISQMTSDYKNGIVTITVPREKVNKSSVKETGKLATK